MREENPEPQHVAVEDTETQVTEHTESHESVEENVSHGESDKTVPLSAHMKERKKRQQLQEERDYYKKLAEQKSTPQPEEEDYSKYESVTREELAKDRFETIRSIRENDWAEEYPERMAIVETELEDFLKQRPNLGAAINTAQNRYKEAWELMNALNPKRKQATSVPKREAPHSPGTVPKAAALNEAIDLMNMSDSEFRNWAKSKRGRR